MQRPLALTSVRSPLASTSGVRQRGQTSLRVSCVARSSHTKRVTFQQRTVEDSRPVSGGLLGATTLLSTYLLDAHAALAKGGELGPALEGRSVSLIHPALMAFLLGTSFYTAWLGWQWRATRLIPAEIKERKALLPKPDEDGKRPSSPLDEEIAQLEQVRLKLKEVEPHPEACHCLLYSCIVPAPTYPKGPCAATHTLPTHSYFSGVCIILP